MPRSSPRAAGRARSRLPRSAAPRLAVLLGGVLVGWVYEDARGRLAFRYEDAWRDDPQTYPLSWSMPLAAELHGDRATRAYLWGLLPDDEVVLAAWARQFGTSPLHAVALLAHVGEDCPGAVQLARPERLAALQGQATPADAATSVTWLTEAEVAARLREVRTHPGRGRLASDTGQFSLPGAQPKTALYETADGRWGVPRGRLPTNRILKPPVLDVEALVANEFLCLRLAEVLGMRTATARMQTFAGVDGEVEDAIVLERYDRRDVGGRVVRVHQEDGCQALAVLPGRKYEAQGGPGIGAIVRLLRAASSRPEVDVTRFLDAVALSWLIAGTDAHAKNYALLHGAGRQVRLAPLYDVISLAPYPARLAAGDHALAMAVGGECRIPAIDGSRWRAEARALRVPADDLLDRIAGLAAAIPDGLTAVVDATAPGPARHALARLAGAIRDHAGACARRLAVAGLR